MKLVICALLVATIACAERSRAPQYEIEYERMYRERITQETPDVP